MPQVPAYSALPIRVRLFNDHAKSPVWVADPMDYRTLRLSPGLERDMRTWEHTYYSGLDEHFRSAAEESAEWIDLGRSLAQRLADELGHDFLIEHDGGEYAGGATATNPAAAAAVRAAAAAADAFWERLTRVTNEHPGARWRWVPRRSNPEDPTPPVP